MTARPGDLVALAALPVGGRAHRAGPDTERLAAASVRPGPLRDLALGLLRAAGPHGLTDDEGGARLRGAWPGADRLTFGRRRQELCLAGLVRDSGARRRTPAGRWAVVWVAAS